MNKCICFLLSLPLALHGAATSAELSPTDFGKKATQVTDVQIKGAIQHLYSNSTSPLYDALTPLHIEGVTTAAANRKDIQAQAFTCYLNVKNSQPIQEAFKQVATFRKQAYDTVLRSAAWEVYFQTCFNMLQEHVKDAIPTFVVDTQSSELVFKIEGSLGLTKEQQAALYRHVFCYTYFLTDHEHDDIDSFNSSFEKYLRAPSPTKIPRSSSGEKCCLQ